MSKRQNSAAGAIGPVAERRRMEGRIWREEEITLADVEWALKNIAKVVQLDGTATYIKILERLIAERERRAEVAALMRLAREIAGEG
jgi:hypothetical protein